MVVPAYGYNLGNQGKKRLHSLILGSRLSSVLGGKGCFLSQDSRVVTGRDSRTTMVSHWLTSWSWGSG
jgi:hypothetical protein